MQLFVVCRCVSVVSYGLATLLLHTTSVIIQHPLPKSGDDLYQTSQRRRLSWREARPWEIAIGRYCCLSLIMQHLILELMYQK